MKGPAKTSGVYLMVRYLCRSCLTCAFAKAWFPDVDVSRERRLSRRTIAKHNRIHRLVRCVRDHRNLFILPLHYQLL